VQNGDHIIRGRDACDPASGPVLRQCRRSAPGYVPTSARATLLSVVAIIVQNDPERPFSYSRVITEVIEAGGVPLLAKLPKNNTLAHGAVSSRVDTRECSGGHSASLRRRCFFRAVVGAPRATATTTGVGFIYYIPPPAVALQ
jgi:hypothetical protein